MRFPELTENQRKALAALEKAFKDCKEANIAIFIMEGGIYAFNAHAADGYMRDAEHDMCTMRDDIENFDDFSGIRHYRVIRDTGAF